MMNKANRKSAPPPQEGETCKWYVSIEEPECGEDALTQVKITNKAGTMVVPLCARHKAVHDEAYARARTARSMAS